MNTRILSFVILILCTGCTTLDICDNDGQSYMVARFRTIEEGMEKDTALAGLTVFGIRNGFPGGMIADSQTVKKIALPLDPGNPVTEFVFRTSEKNDTLIIYHSSEAYLISYNCGFAARFRLGSPEHAGTLIKGLEVRNEKVDAETETNEEHIHIFF